MPTAFAASSIFRCVSSAAIASSFFRANFPPGALRELRSQGYGRTLLATLSGAFGTLALLLSLVGLYGVMSFVAAQRTREIGIRMALGATGASAIWLVLRDALAMIAAGAAIALPCVAALGRRATH